MTRLVRFMPNLEPVERYAVAPHRYLWNAPIPEVLPTTYREVKAAAPYQAGDVIFAEIGKLVLRCYVLDVLCELDRFYDLRELYTVLPETKAGTFARQYRRISPGHVQRAYKAKGLAPEMPDDL